ncbi:MAG: ribulose-phosphate 3-epimerase [Anaerolineales bacterium]|nr:ribulose-phosphate 3-epimerase [Anaerolineales bacterium]MCX7755943.1 ribulose-phosphate 3-epimerase [Anaerolineales bacterium]MDW8276871.1 ribulose-phosphate 3-epimerase [Anaerolineales bacterium]
MPFVLAPSILSADFTRLGEEIRAAEEAGADWIHLDVMDGHFVPNMTIGPLVVEACRRATRLPLDVHLMIEQPERYLEAFARAGADRLTVHVETCPHLHRTLQQIRALGVRPGVTLNPGTPAVLLKEVLPLADLVLVMTVNPGFGAQSFLPETLPKIAEIRRMLAAIQSSAWLEVDGGVAEATLPQLIAAGANAFVAGNAVFKHPHGPGAGVRALKAVLNNFSSP